MNLTNILWHSNTYTSIDKTARTIQIFGIVSIVPFSLKMPIGFC